MFAVITAISVGLLLAILLRLRYRFNSKREHCRALVIIPVTADDKLFEKRVKSCYWEEAFADPMFAKEILLVVMEKSANAFAAQRISQEYSNVHTIHISSLSDYLRRNYNGKQYNKTDS
jgi:hypothetical protein